ncbi:hypothetical protein AALC25_09140 [Lachnospiraceae bacterium 29-84]
MSKGKEKLNLKQKILKRIKDIIHFLKRTICEYKKTGIFLLFIIFIILIIVDLVHAGFLQYPWTKRIYCCIAYILHGIGADYDRAFTLLSGTLGTLVTTISLILNIGITIANRSEGKFFGIPRKDWDGINNKNPSNVHYIIYFSPPLLMILSINLGLCLTGYAIFCFNYIYLIITYIRCSKSYKEEHYYHIAIHTFLSYTQQDDFLAEENIINYQNLIGEIQKGIEQSEGWRKAEILYRYFLEELHNLEEEKGCFLIYHFFYGIFRSGNDKTTLEATQWLKIYINKMLEANTYPGQHDSPKDAIILWGMISALLDGWTEQNLLQFLTWYLDFPGRSIYKKLTSQFEGITETEMFQAGIILIGVEYWLQKKEGHNIQYEETLLLLWKYGKPILKLDSLLDSIIFIHGKINGQEQEKFSGYIENLKNDCETDMQRSLICHMIHYSYK